MSPLSDEQKRQIRETRLRLGDTPEDLDREDREREELANVVPFVPDYPAPRPEPDEIDQEYMERRLGKGKRL
jgi:hypothetical protein